MHGLTVLYSAVLLNVATVKIQINRNLAIPIYTQIVGQLQFDIATGRLASGTLLPSIRDLAHDLNLAPMTITQAYQELRQLGLIETRPGLGTYVASFDAAEPGEPVANRALQLRRILQRAIGEAHNEGFSEEAIKQGFLSLLTASNGLVASRRLGLVGLFADTLRVYADDLERRLASEQVVVDPITFGELEEHPELYRGRIEQAEAILTPLHQVQRLRDVLQANGLGDTHALMGLSLVLRPSAQQAIAALPSTTQVGVVSTFGEFVVTMIQGIAAINPLQPEPVVCLSNDEEALRQMARTVQAIVYASGANAAVAALAPALPAGMPMIEFLHTPDEAGIERIRRWLAQHARPRPPV